MMDDVIRNAGYILLTRELVHYMHFFKKVEQADELGHLDKVECSGSNQSLANIRSTQQQQEQYAVHSCSSRSSTPYAAKCLRPDCMVEPIGRDMGLSLLACHSHGQ
jgi:Mn-containing catalase